jgi:2'-5' RNA ligase
LPESESGPSIDPVRLFIAVELPTAVLAALTALQKRLKTLDRERAIRWTAAEGVHLTLKFLGETTSDRIPAIVTGLEQAAGGKTPFDLSMTGVGCFPNLQRPRVVWAGLRGDMGALRRLQEAVEEHIAPLGYPTEARAFSPHLTLGRARREASTGALAAFGKQIEQVGAATAEAVNWRVEAVSLMRSDLKPSGALYTRLAHVPLA